MIRNSPVQPSHIIAVSSLLHIEKKRDILSLTEQIQELKLNLVGSNKVPTDEEFEQLKQQIRDIKSKHIELFARTKISDKISEKDLEKFYNEIGESKYIEKLEFNFFI